MYLKVELIPTLDLAHLASGVKSKRKRNPMEASETIFLSQLYSKLKMITHQNMAHMDPIIFLRNWKEPEE